MKSEVMKERSTIHDFPIDEFGITIDLNIFTDAADQLQIECIIKPEDVEEYGEEEIVLAAEKILHEVLYAAVEAARTGES
jgi:hypothetical protein